MRPAPEPTEYTHYWQTDTPGSAMTTDTDRAIHEFVPARPTWLERAFAPFCGGVLVTVLMAASALGGFICGLGVRP